MSKKKQFKKLTNQSKVIINVLSLALALLIISGALIWKSNHQPDITVTINPNKPFSKQELASATGKDGNQCLVAIEGTVYKIEDSDLWKNGEHTTSEGQAYCGLDLTEVLKKSPHGKSKLEQLENVGSLEQ